MAKQSQVPAILLTRPLAQSQRFARQMRVRAGKPVPIFISPLMQLELLEPALPQLPPTGLIFTSEAGIAAYLHLTDRPVAPAWCVGQRTAQMAQSTGLEPVLVAKDAHALILQMSELRPSGTFLHLRGEDSHGNIAATLSAAGIPTLQATVYAQRPLPLRPHAQRLLASDLSIIVPLFSARSARLFFAAVPNHPRLTITALSGAVAAAIPPDADVRLLISKTPDANGMLETILPLLAEPASA